MAWNGSAEKPVAPKPQRAKPRMPMAAWIAAGAIAVAAAAFVGWLLMAGGHDEEVASAPAKKLQRNAGRYALSPEEAVRRALPPGAGEKARKNRPRSSTELSFDHLEGKDRKLAEAVQAALDADDLEATLSATKAALKSDNSEVRQAAVEALGWFGVDALPELTGCMADPDEDVRQAAGNQWEQAVQEIESPDQQFAVAVAAFATLSDEDQLTSIGGILNGAAAEMIDGEEDEGKAAENRLSVLQSLVDIIEGGRAKNVEAAKEAYNDITGNEWLGIDEAERYLADPDNYEAPEQADPSNETALPEPEPDAGASV